MGGLRGGMSRPSSPSIEEEPGVERRGPSWGAALEAGGQERRQGRFIVRRRPAGGVPGRREWRRRRGGHGGRRSGGIERGGGAGEWRKKGGVGDRGEETLWSRVSSAWGLFGWADGPDG
jgi:hypothetical protein